MRTDASRRNERGAVIVTVAILLTAILGMAALAVDASYLMEIRAQLQNTADATAMAAVSGLSLSRVDAENRAADYAARNPVLGKTVKVDNSNLIFGQWDSDTGRFSPTNASPNAIGLTLRLSDTPALANPALFFAPVLGFRTNDVSARATASLGNRNVMLVLDRSTSMDDLGGNPVQPVTDVKASASQFFSMLQNFPIKNDKSGFVSFNERASLDRRLTENYQLVRNTIDAFQICYPPACGGYTNIAEGLRVARQELTSSRASTRALKVVVMLSDGRANTTIGGTGGNMCQPGTNPCQTLPGNRAEQECLDQSRRLRDIGAVLYTISLGFDTNVALMDRMAVETGGDHFLAPTASQLDGIFQQISARVPVVLVE